MPPINKNLFSLENEKQVLIFLKSYWCNAAAKLCKNPVVYVAVNFLFQLIFIFLLFLGMVMYANKF